MLSIIGKFTNAAIGWALPGLSANALYIVAGLLSVGIPSAYAWHKGTEGKAAAVATADARCEVRIAEMRAVSATTLASILTEIKEHEDDDAGKTAKDLCKGSPFCRERKKQ